MLGDAIAYKKDGSDRKRWLNDFLFSDDQVERTTIGQAPDNSLSRGRLRGNLKDFAVNEYFRQLFCRQQNVRCQTTVHVDTSDVPGTYIRCIGCKKYIRCIGWARNVEQPQSRRQCLDTLNLVQIKNRVSDEPSTPSVSNAPFSPGAPGELCSSEPGELCSSEPGELCSGEPGELCSGEPGKLCSGEPGELFSGRQQWLQWLGCPAPRGF